MHWKKMLILKKKKANISYIVIFRPIVQTDRMQGCTNKSRISAKV